MSFLADFFKDRESNQHQEKMQRREIAGPILAVDIGSVYTRAVLLDVVEGAYRFVAHSTVPTTAMPPVNNIYEGVLQAIQAITQATGHVILDENYQMIWGQGDDFYGVNLFTATASAGEPIRAVLVGLMPDVSLSSGNRAADSIYLMKVDEFSMADRRTPEQRINALIRAEPELILIVGGTDGGAVDSLREQIDTVALACGLMEQRHRPTVLYAGNTDLREEVQEKLGEGVGMQVFVADNVRPRLDIEYLDGAQTVLASLYHAQKSESTRGFAEVGHWTQGGVTPTAHAFNRMVRILKQLRGHDVLGIDLGSASVTVSVSIKGRQYLNVLGDLGMGHSARKAIAQLRIESLLRWLSYEPKHPDDVLNYVWNKSIFPHTIPTTQEELEIEYALAREITRRAVLSARASWLDVRQSGLLPPFGTLLLSGSTLTRPPHLGWSALNALDALLSVGITRVLLDPYGLAPALGAIAPHAPPAVVQTLEAGAFVELGTVISLSGRARRGEIVLRGTVTLKGDEASKGTIFEIRQGTIVRLPLPVGQEAVLTLEPRRMNIETSDGKPIRRISVMGGELGLIIDARGRPWQFPRDPEARQHLMQEWQRAMLKSQEGLV